MSRRIVGFISLVIVAIAAVGLMSFTFLGTASGVASNASGSAYGVKASVEVPLLGLKPIDVGPLPQAVADKVKLSDEASLVRLGDIPPGGALIHEIAALLTTARVNLSAGTATASSDTAHIGLLRTTTVNTGVPGVGGVPLPGGGLPALPGLPVPSLPIIGNPVAGVGATTTQNQIDIDAIHGVVSLDCNKLAALSALKGVGEAERLNAITEGSHILRAQIPLLNLDVRVLDELTDNLGNSSDDHMAAFHARIDLAALNLPALPAPLNVLNGRLLEIWLYEVKGHNLSTPSLTNATVGATVDMVHVKVLDKATGVAEIDLRIGHAEASLSNCGKTTPPPPPPVCVVQPCVPVIDTNVEVSKVVESIAGKVVTTQSNLTAQRGQDVEYSLNVFNRTDPRKSCAITKVVDQLPAGMTLVSEAGQLGGGVYDSVANTITWSGLAIANGSAARHGVVVRLASDAPNGVYVNRFTSTGTCGTHTAIAPGITVGPAGTQVLPAKFERGVTPRTGVADSLMWVTGGLLMAGALAGAWTVRKA